MNKILKIILAAAAVLGMALIATSHDSPKEPAAPTTKQAATAVDAEINKPAPDGNLKFTINEFKCGLPWAGDPGEYDIHQLPKGKLCQARVKVENTSKVDRDFSWEGQLLVGSDNKKYPVDLGFYGDKLVPRPWHPLKPNEPIDAIIVFDIPKDVKPTTLEMRESVNSPGIRLNVSNYK